MLLNCDMGESFGAWKMGQDQNIMPFIDQANIACGFHASDPQVMAQTISLAQQHQVSIGAHPGYQDLIGFGRRSIPMHNNELRCLLLYQIGALQAICDAQGAQVDYVKPHGALYNDMMKDESIFTCIVSSLSELSTPLGLMVQAGERQNRYEALAKPLGVDLIFEAFLDRRYMDNGSLMPRDQQGAVLSSAEALQQQAQQLNAGYVLTASGAQYPIEAQTLCIHGDNPAAVQFIIQQST